MSGARPQPWGDAKPQDLSLIKELPRIRVEYGKGDRLAFLGHLEVSGANRVLDFVDVEGDL